MGKKKNKTLALAVVPPSKRSRQQEPPALVDDATTTAGAATGPQQESKKAKRRAKKLAKAAMRDSNPFAALARATEAPLSADAAAVAAEAAAVRQAVYGENGVPTLELRDSANSVLLPSTGASGALLAAVAVTALCACLAGAIRRAEPGERVSRSLGRLFLLSLCA